MSVRIDSGELYRLMSSPQGPLYQYMTSRARVVKGRAKILCPVRKTEGGGKLRASINEEIRIENGLPVAYIGTNTVYAMFVHEGTGPHRIYPKKKKALAFDWPNGPADIKRSKKTGKVVRNYVNHPGTKPNPFLRDALRQIMGQA